MTHTALNPSHTGVLTLNGHFKRLVTTLNSLYEFGPSYLDKMQVTGDLTLAEYKKSADSLTLSELSLGLRRCEALGDVRKRIAPTPTNFSLISKMDVEAWLLEQGSYSLAIEEDKFYE